MPVSNNDEFFFPRCETLEEIWPALLTKALIKLYSYKIISNKYYEIGDLEPFYALTGYIPTILKEIKIENKNKELNEEEDKNKSKIIETNSKKDESKKENKLNDSLDENKNEEKEEKEKEEEKKEEEIPKEKLDFLEKALTDENYANSNYLVECFKSIEKNFYKVQNDLNNLDEEEEEEIIQQMHINEKNENKERRT